MTQRPHIFMVRYGTMLVPLDEAAEREIERLPFKKPIRVRLGAVRSLPQSRLYWAMCDRVAENTAGMTKDEIHQLILHATGWAKSVKRANGEVIVLYPSISFDGMDHQTFTRFMDQAKSFVCREVLPGLNIDALTREIEAMLAPIQPGDTDNGQEEPVKD